MSIGNRRGMEGDDGPQRSVDGMRVRQARKRQGAEKGDGAVMRGIGIASQFLNDDPPDPDEVRRRIEMLRRDMVELERQANRALNCGDIEEFDALMMERRSHAIAIHDMGGEL